jgi:hypothetical protein
MIGMVLFAGFIATAPDWTAWLFLVPLMLMLAHTWYKAIKEELTSSEERVEY